MPRKGNVPKREVLPDPVYGSVVVAKLINSIMLDGKKGTAQSIVYDAFTTIEKQTGENPLEVFEKAMKYISDRKPLHETEKEKDKRIKEVYEYVHWDSKMNA